MVDPRCLNCGYESESLDNAKEFCDTCWKAYQLGKEEVNG